MVAKKTTPVKKPTKKTPTHTKPKKAAAKPNSKSNIKAKSKVSHSNKSKTSNGKKYKSKTKKHSSLKSLFHKLTIKKLFVIILILLTLMIGISPLINIGLEFSLKNNMICDLTNSDDCDIISNSDDLNKPIEEVYVEPSLQEIVEYNSFVNCIFNDHKIISSFIEYIELENLVNINFESNYESESKLEDATLEMSNCVQDVALAHGVTGMKINILGRSDEVSFHYAG